MGVVVGVADRDRQVGRHSVHQLHGDEDGLGLELVAVEALVGGDHAELEARTAGGDVEAVLRVGLPTTVVPSTASSFNVPSIHVCRVGLHT